MTMKYDHVFQQDFSFKKRFIQIFYFKLCVSPIKSIISCIRDVPLSQIKKMIGHDSTTVGFEF